MKDKVWQELPIGGVIDAPGNAKKYKTGGWRSLRPIFDKSKCINCYFCWIYCPDNSIIIGENKDVKGMDMEYCKGCGICAEVCPKDAIKMEEESKFLEE